MEDKLLFEEESKFEPSDIEDEEPGMGKGKKQDDHLCPVVKISSEELHEARRPWKKAVIVKVIGKRLGIRFLRSRLLKLWQLKGILEIMDLEHDYFLVRLSE